MTHGKPREMPPGNISVVKTLVLHHPVCIVQDHLVGQLDGLHGGFVHGRAGEKNEGGIRRGYLRDSVGGSDGACREYFVADVDDVGHTGGRRKAWKKGLQDDDGDMLDEVAEDRQEAGKKGVGDDNGCRLQLLQDGGPNLRLGRSAQRRSNRSKSPQSPMGQWKEGSVRSEQSDAPRGPRLTGSR